MIVSSFIPRAGATLFDAASWIRSVTAALGRGLTLGDNMAGRVVAFRYNSDAPPTIPVSFAVASVVLVGARRTDGTPTMLSGGVVMWEPTKDGKAVLVVSIGALTASTDYDVTLWLVGG